MLQATVETTMYNVPRSANAKYDFIFTFFSIEYIKKTYFDVFLCFFGVDSSI